MNPTAVLATITGRDRPGVTAALFAALAAHDVDVRDVEQVTIRGRLMIAVLLELRGDPAALRNSVTQTSHALGMECEVALADEARTPPQHGPRRSHVIVLGRPLRPGALSEVAQRVADRGNNIESVAQLSTEPLSSVEMIVESDDPAELHRALVRAAAEAGVDIAVQRAELRRRAKRLVVLDGDCTVIGGDAIELLASRAGLPDRVAGSTDDTEEGEPDPADTLRKRAKLLAGLPAAELEAVRDGLVLTPGARTCVRALHRLGFRVGVVSSGFSVVSDRLMTELGADFVTANSLEIVDGRLTGRLLGPVVDRAGKAVALQRFAAQAGVPIAQTVAVGDGATDVELLGAAGLAIAFNPKCAPRDSDSAPVEPAYLDTVLFVLGIARAELDELDEVDERR